MAYNVNGILNVPVRPELAFDVLVTQHPHLGRQELAVATQ